MFASVLFAALAPRVSQAEAFRLLEAGPGEIRFEFRGDPARFTRADDGIFALVDSTHPSQPCGPTATLPSACTWIALPPGAAASVSMQALEETPLPWPEGTTPSERESLLKLLPEQGWAAPPECWVRNQWGRSVRFCPLIGEGRGGLRYVRQAVFRVTFRGGAAGASRSASGRDPFESLYRGQFLNYEQGRAWRRGFEPGARARARSDYFTSTTAPWIKLSVPQRGIYEVRGQDLEGIGISLTSIDPQTLRLFTAPPHPLDEDLSVDQSPSWMSEVPIEVLDGQDGSFDEGDAIRFLGQGPDGWRRDLGITETHYDRYYRDYYNNANVYWLTWGGDFGGAPQRIDTVDGSEVFDPADTVVEDVIHLEQARTWDPRPRESLDLPPDSVPAWQRYWWVTFSLNSNDTEQTLRVTIPDPVTDAPVRVRARFWGYSYHDALHHPVWPDHLLRMSLNGTLIAQKDRLRDGEDWDGYRYVDVDTTGLWLAQTEQKFGFTLPVHPLPPYDDEVRDADYITLAWIEMGYSRRIVAHGDTLAFTAGGLSGAHTLDLTGFTRDDIVVMDATDPVHPFWVTPAVSATEGGSGYHARIRADLDPEAPRQYLASSASRLLRPALKLKVPPSEGYLRERNAAVQAIIITHSDFKTQAEVLAQFRRGHLPGYPAAEVAVVDIQDILDEFSFGRMDPTAVRNFLQFARAHWNGGDSEQGPAFVTLLGDTNYDFRNQLGQGARVFVPTYEGFYDTSLLYTSYSPQFASDDYFGYLDGPNDSGLDLFIGRLPAQSQMQAETLVQKVIGYESTGAHEPWRGRVTLVADDICQATHPDGLTYEHMRQTEQLPPRLPASLQKDKIFLYEYGTECEYDRKPAAAEALKERINDGTLVVNFTGHGSEQQLADERVLEISSVPALTNRDRLFMFITASCSVGKYDFFGQSLGEALLLHPSGGAVSVFCASAVANSAGNAELNQKFYEAEFPSRDATDARPIGEAVAVAKASTGIPGNLNSKRYTLLGDPATRLAAPALSIDLSLSDARSRAALGDTLGRGVRTLVTGRLLRHDGTPAEDFNGTASVRVYDSAVHRLTASPDSLSYDLLGAPIYRGEATVRGGVFTTIFQTPSTLRTGTRGFAGIYVYAEDGDTDAGGSLDSLVVPEREAPPSADEEGPVINLRFEGNPQALRPQAWFQASLKDSSGINITGLVGSRSVVMQVEEENGSLVSAQDLASLVTFGASYDSAWVRANLPSNLQTEHSYVLVLRASDNLKNSSSVRLPFRIGTGEVGGFDLTGVYNFPNPTESGARFYGTITGDADLDVVLYTLSGRRVWKLGHPVRMSPSELSQQGIPWDGRDADGDALANGVYLYKLSARSVEDGRSVTRTEKLVVFRRK